MRGKKHTEEQIIVILKQPENGLKTAEVCRQHGITEQTLYRWKAKYGGMDGRDSRKLREVLDENRISTIAAAPFPSSQECSSERRGAVKGARLLRGECEPLTAGTVPENGHRGKGGFPSSASTFPKSGHSTLPRHHDRIVYGIPLLS